MQWNYGSQENLALYERLIQEQYKGVPASPSDVTSVNKADAPILSSTTGFFNPVYGASVMQQLAHDSVLFGMLPKYPYKKRGFRAETTRFVTSGVGVAENAAVPDSVKNAIAAVDVPIKEHAITVEISERQRLLMEAGDDTAYTDYAGVMESAKRSFSYAYDADINTDVTTVASNNSESIDRVVSSYAEVNNCADVNANDADIYSLDRDAAASWTDAYVNHGSNVTRVLSDTIVRAVMSNTVSNGADPRTQVWYTGADTYEALVGLYGTQNRYAMQFTGPGTSAVSGEPAKGIAYGMEMATLYGRPFFVAPTGKVVANGAAGAGTAISNLYLLDLGTDTIYGEPILGIKTLRAPILAKTGLMDGYPAHAKLGNETIIYAAMELECKNFKRQGKARDLAAP